MTIKAIQQLSPLLGRKLVLHPEWQIYCSRQTSTLPPIIHQQTGSQVEKILRDFKYQALLQVVAKTLQGETFESIGKFWSQAADQMVQVAFTSVEAELTRQHGAPLPFEFSVIAMGKLGAEELNLSSDIDLLFIFQSSLDPRQLPEQLALRLTQLLSKITPDGFVFRVDNDLRPEGSQGPLTNSLAALEQYYESRGADWERMALIRARPIAGSELLGKAFLKTVRPFIYRKNLTLSDLKHLRVIKEEMELQSRRGLHNTFNLKQGVGGIRELEFIVHALQSLHGGRHEELREHNTFAALRALEKTKLLPKKICEQLTEGYNFLRFLENGLQMAEDQQTHTLPPSESTAEWDRLAKACCISKVTTLKNKLEKHPTQIHKIFLSLFEQEYEKILLEEAMRANTLASDHREEQYEGLAWFKRQETQRIFQLEQNGKTPFPEILKSLTLVAEVTLKEATRLVAQDFPVAPAVLGLGRLGSQEMDYNSDLDLIFVYSAPGTQGHETSTRFVQRLIAALSSPTRYGKAYAIDCDLRPSGRSGVLVTSLETFRRYHLEEAALWERFALARARPVAGPKLLREQLTRLIDELVYERPLPKDAPEQLALLHQKMKAELAFEKSGHYNLKEGPGGIANIEAILQLLQIRHGGTIPYLRQTNSFAILNALQKEEILSAQESGTLSQTLLQWRQWIASLRLLSSSQTTWLELAHPLAMQVAQSIGFENINSLQEALEESRKQVQIIYDRYFGKVCA